MTQTTSTPAPGISQELTTPPVPEVFRTAVPAFLGRATGRSSQPQRLTQWPEFETYFDLAPGSFLGAAVKGFFDNDGLLCYVVPLEETLGMQAALAKALEALESVDDVDLICAPDLVAEATQQAGRSLDIVVNGQRQLLEHCEARADRFALLDSLPTADLAGVRAQALALTGPSGAFGALYYPWVWPGDGDIHYCPPSGHVAGTYSRADQRVGPHKPPANEPISSILSLQTSLTDSPLQELYQVGVNCLRAYPGGGVRAYGARTLSPDDAWRDINTRRMFATIGRWLESFMQDHAFEVNGPTLWIGIHRECTFFLQRLLEGGALRGSSASEAFYVTCDASTNSPEAIDAGIVVTQIGVALSAPAEFFTLRISSGASGVQVSAA